MKRIREIAELKENLRAHADILHVIGSYVPLEVRGQNAWGSCPFHSETTASFNVTPDAGLWSCFGCRESGDIYAFVQQIQGCSFVEAIEIIAESSDFSLDSYYRELTPEEQLREDRYAALAQVADLFHEALMQAPSELNFFDQRGIEVDTLKDFKIGYCPSLRWLEAQVDDAVLNLIDPSEENRARLFDGHILYPQFNAAGQVWGWYARMPQGEKPKYLGVSQKAALFEGTARLYGFSQARKRLRKSQLPLLIVEGFNDVLAAYQANFAATATCGTELTTDQIETLQSYAVREAIVIFDGDEGGAKGMLRLAEGAYKIKSPNLKFLTIPGDPDEFISNNGAELFAVSCDQALCAIEFVMQHYAKLYRVATPTQSLDFLNHVRPFLLQYPPSSINRAIGVKVLSGLLDIQIEAITDFLEENAENPLANHRAETIVLAEFAMNPQAWILYPDIQPTDFMLKRHEKTFDLMMQCYQLSGAVNIELLLSEAHNRHYDKSVSEIILQLSVFDRTNVEHFVTDIKDKSLRRQAESLALHAAKKVYDLQAPAVGTIGDLVVGVTSILHNRSSATVLSSAQATEIAAAQFEERSLGDKEIWGLSLGDPWSNLNGWINGLLPGKQHLIAALSGVGKSIVGANWVHRLSIANDGPQAAGLVVSLEMNATENIMRLVAIDSKVPHLYVDRAQFESEEQANLVRASFERYYNARITWMTSKRTSMRDIELQCRILQSRGELEYVMIDYVQLLNLNIYNDRWSKIDKFAAVSDDILSLADNLQIPVVTIAQLNKDAYDAAVPTGEQMANCYDIYRDAHVCYILASRTKTMILGSLDKNRGSTSTQTCNLLFDQNAQTSNLIIKETNASLPNSGPPQ